MTPIEDHRDRAKDLNWQEEWMTKQGRMWQGICAVVVFLLVLFGSGYAASQSALTHTCDREAVNGSLRFCYCTAPGGQKYNYRVNKGKKCAVDLRARP